MSELVAQVYRNEVLRSLVELMALHVPRDKMPSAERNMLDAVLGREVGT